MRQSYSHCDAPETSCLRLVLIGDILHADETRPVLRADVWQPSGLLAPPEAPQTTMISTTRQRPRTPYEPMSGDGVMYPDLVHAFVVSERL